MKAEKEADKNKTEDTYESFEEIQKRIDNTIAISCKNIYNAITDAEDTYTKEDIAASVEKSIANIKTKLAESIKNLPFSERAELDNYIEKVKDTRINALLEDLSKKEIKVYDNINASNKKNNKDAVANNSTSNKTDAARNKEGLNSSASDYLYKNVSYSGTDMVVMAQLCMGNQKSEFMTIGSLQTMTYSVYDRMEPIHSLGNVNAKEYVHTHRYIAGSMVFAVFDRHWAKDFLKKYMETAGISSSEKILTDEMPPVNLTVTMGNEYGSSSRLALYSVRFFNEGMTMSINDVYTEHTYQFVALNIDYLENVQTPTESKISIDRLLALKPREVSTSSAEQANESQDNKEDDGDKKDDGENKDDAAEQERVKVDGLTSDDYIKNAISNLSKDGKTPSLSKIQNKALDDVTKAYEKNMDELNKTYKEKIKNGEATKVDLENEKAKLKKAWKDVKNEIKAYINEEKKKEKESKSDKKE